MPKKLLKLFAPVPLRGMAGFAVLLWIWAVGLPMTPPPAIAQPVPGNPLPQLVANLLPSVVSIVTYTRHRSVPDPTKPNVEKVTRTKSVGSGFIVSPDGLIATAGHVIDGVDQLIVTLHDGTTMPGIVVYRAPTDIALIKIEPGRPLPVAAMGDSDQVRIGDEVVSVGNPLGLGFTVTTGIISALDRDIHQSPADAFLQTDAPINPGNSGGPLFNRRGQVIGQNNSIYTVAADQGSAGLGFATRGNEVKFVIAHFNRFGRVRLGWLGAHVQNVTPDIALGVGLPQPRGVLVSSVVPGSPADRAKLRAGDVVTMVFGSRTDSPRWASRIIAAAPVDEIIEVQYFRDGGYFAVDVRWAEDPATRDAKPTPPPPPPVPPHPSMGLTLAPIDDALRARFNLPPSANGVVVTDVIPFSAGADLGVDPGDMVIQVGQKPITSADEMRAAVRAAIEAKQPRLMVLLTDGKGARWVAAPTPEQVRQ